MVHALAGGFFKASAGGGSKPELEKFLAEAGDAPAQML
jgi:hypothetical protein